MRIRIIITVVITILIGSQAWLINELLDARKEKRRIESSFEASRQNLAFYKSENGKLVAKVRVLELKNTELGKIFPDILKEIEQLKLNPRHVNHYSETVISQEKEIIKELRDSIIYDTIRIKAFDFVDEFYNVNGNIRDDSIRMNITSTDSIIQVVYRGKRPKPWLWIFSPRVLEQVIQSKNPSSKITYSKSIQISR